LLEKVQALLRKAIATHLKLTKADYESSLDATNAVNRLLTNVMSIGYNKGDMHEVLDELCTARHFGDQDNEAVIEAMRGEIALTQLKLSSEIAAFTKMHEMNQAGAAPAVTWAQIQTMLVVGEEYETTA